MRLEFFLLTSEVDLYLFHPCLQILLLFVNFGNELLVRDLHGLDLSLTIGKVLVVPQHHLHLFSC